MMRSFERMFATVGAFLDAALFRPTQTIEDDIAQRDAKTRQEISDCDKVIKRHTFVRHMALAERKAMEDWKAGYVLCERESNTKEIYERIVRSASCAQ